MSNITNLFYYLGSLKIAGIFCDATVSDGDVSALTSNTSTLDSILQILGLLVLFIIIIIAAYFATRWLGTVTAGNISNNNIKIIETYKISQTKYIQIVCVTDKYFAIGVSKDNITLLGEIDKESIAFKENAVKTKDFKKIIEGFTKKKDSK